MGPPLRSGRKGSENSSTPQIVKISNDQADKKNDFGNKQEEIMRQQIKDIEAKYMKKNPAKFNIGDAVDVHYKIKEENKTRIQIFSGIVIGAKGTGLCRNFTVRRISYGEGVERIFPLNSPAIEKIVIKKRGKIRRAKLYYLRSKKGKKASKVKEKIVQKKRGAESE